MSTENTTLLQTSSNIERLRHDFTTHKLQYTVNLTIDKTQSMKLIKVQPIPLGVSMSKAQSSKLEHLFYHVSVKREVRALKFELETPRVGSAIRFCLVLSWEAPQLLSWEAP